MLKVLVALGSVAAAILFVSRPAQAAVVEVDVTIKSVDAKARATWYAHDKPFGVYTYKPPRLPDPDPEP